MYKTLFVALAALMLVSSVPSGSAALASVSGQCYNADASEGGGGTLSTDDPLAFPGQVLSIVDALALFATESANDGTTGNACKRYDCTQEEVDAGTCEGSTARKDYLAVHVLDGTVEACYQGNTDASILSVGEPECPEQANGPGAN